MKVSRCSGHLALMALAASLAACEMGLEHSQESFALTDQEIEDEKEAMCDGFGCETTVTKDWFFGECREHWTRTDSTVCDLEAGVTRTTIVYTRHDPLSRSTYGDPPRCDYAVSTWTVTYAVPIPDGEACEDGGSGDDADGG